MYYALHRARIIDIAMTSGLFLISGIDNGPPAGGNWTRKYISETFEETDEVPASCVSGGASDVGHTRILALSVREIEFFWRIDS